MEAKKVSDEHGTCEKTPHIQSAVACVHRVESVYAKAAAAFPSLSLSFPNKLFGVVCPARSWDDVATCWRLEVEGDGVRAAEATESF